MKSELVFADNAVSSYYFFLFLNYWLMLSNPIVDLIIPLEISIKETKAKK